MIYLQPYLSIVKRFFMKKNTSYIPMLLEGLTAWLRIGETLIYSKQYIKIPLNNESSLTQLKSVLPRFENIRNFVVVEIIKPKFKKGTFFTYVSYDEIRAIYPLDANPKSHEYLQNLVPSVKIEKQSILDESLSNTLSSWSEKRDAILGAEKLLSVTKLKNNCFLDKNSILDTVLNACFLKELPNDATNCFLDKNSTWDTVLDACFLKELPNDATEITRFFYALFTFNRNTIKCKYRFEDLGFIDDMSKVLQEAIDEETLKELNLSYGETLKDLKNNHANDSLAQLIKKILENKNLIEGLEKYYEDDYFISALIFLKLKQLHQNSINKEVFYNLVNELNAIGCNSKLISDGISWYGAYFGYIEIRDLYYEIFEPPKSTGTPPPPHNKSIFFSVPISGKKATGKENNPYYAVFDEHGKYEVREKDTRKNQEWVSYDRLKELYSKDENIEIKMIKEGSSRGWFRDLCEVKGLK